MSTKTFTTAAILAATTSTAFAGGLERATFSPAILYEKGNYVEAAVAMTTPKVSSEQFGPFAGSDPAESFATLKLGFKFDVSDKFSVAMTFNNNPIGADINYTNTPLGAATGNLAGYVNAQATTLLGKYRFNDRISAFGGLKYQSVSANANILATSINGVTTPVGLSNASFEKESEVGYIAGIAYEIPDIALRASLTFESKIDYNLDTIVGGNSVGTASAATPETWQLDFQTGVAKDTLVFATVRRAAWSDANITVPTVNPALPSLPLTNYEDTTSYTLGVGRKLSENVSGSFSLYYEAAQGGASSLLSPSDGIFGGALGLSASVGNGIKIGGGISYTNRGDTFSSNGIQFSNNAVTTVGFKISKNF